jgi:hypothetical protein
MEQSPVFTFTPLWPWLIVPGPLAGRRQLSSVSPVRVNFSLEIEEVPLCSTCCESQMWRDSPGKMPVETLPTRQCPAFWKAMVKDKEALRFSAAVLLRNHLLKIDRQCHHRSS